MKNLLNGIKNVFYGNSFSANTITEYNRYRYFNELGGPITDIFAFSLPGGTEGNAHVSFEITPKYNVLTVNIDDLTVNIRPFVGVTDVLNGIDTTERMFKMILESGTSLGDVSFNNGVLYVYIVYSVSDN